MAEIKMKFRSLCRELHPDKNPDAPRDEFQEVVAAYGVLVDPLMRKRYDEDGRVATARENI